jgi:hypothetical protein
MKKFLKNIVNVFAKHRKIKEDINNKKISGSGHFRQFPVRVRVGVTLFTDHRECRGK